MSTMSNLDKLQEVFRDVFDDETLVITREMTAADIEDWDSLTHIDLITASEATFAVRFNTGEIMKLKDIGDMLDLIDKKLKI